MLEYLLTHTPEEAAEIVRALPRDQKVALVHAICGTVNTMAEGIVANAEEIWENRDGQ